MLGEILSFLGGERRNSAQTEASNAQMAFQERMSSTAYQRATLDMQKAGLNPMLAYSQGPASSPQGAMPDIEDSIGPAVQTAFQRQRLEQEISNMKAQNEQIKSQTRATDAQAQNIAADTAVKSAELPRISAATQNLQTSSSQMLSQIKNLEEQNKEITARIVNLGKEGPRIDATVQEILAHTKNLNTDTIYKSVLSALARANIKLTNAQILELKSLLPSKLAISAAETQLKQNAVPESAAHGSFYESAYGKATPYIDSVLGNIGTIVGTAGGVMIGRRLGGGLGPTKEAAERLGNGKVTRRLSK